MKKLRTMAWRIDEAVIRGEIDNTVEGRTVGKVWLLGREEPINLKLDGDCWRDLAGTKLLFENPNPKINEDSQAVDIDQTGIIGDVTASRKTRVPLVRQDDTFTADEKTGDETPHEWRNSFYLEWFSEINGRVVIETCQFKLTVSDQQWFMDQDAEEAQKLANLNSMRDFMAQVIRRRKSESTKTRQSGEMDEFAWEERLRESDRLTDAYQEVLEKYMDDSDCERKEAFVMGWDGLLDALAERDEAGEEDYPGASSSADFDVDENLGVYDPDEPDEGPDGSLDSDDNNHPLQLKSRELSMRAVDLAERGEGPGTASYRLISSLLQVSGKLAGALGTHGSGYEPETGFILAVLKRCLGWINDAMGACGELLTREEDVDQRAALEHLRRSCFEIRDDIVELRRELKQS